MNANNTAPFRLLVITPECLYREETSWVSRLFANGLETLHLRKPGWGEGLLLDYLKKIDARYHAQIMVHRQASLLEYFPLKGVHFQQHTLPQVRPRYTVSCPVHSWQEFMAVEDRVDYALISPFFDSISKKGYGANTQLHAVPAEACRQKAIALGGIDANTLKAVRKLGVGGAALMGALWQTTDPLSAFLQIQDKLITYA